VTGIVPWVSIGSLLALVGLGVVSARVGGAPPLVATGRIVFWGAAAMALTAAVGHWFGAVV
jgi:VIT1/CCC1 family predicted Fe2+/Mn2+ transporter